MKSDVDFSEIEELLREWGFIFRDRRRFESCRSMEHRFKPHSDDFAKEGWGVMEKPPTESRKKASLLRAEVTNDVVMNLPKVQKWGLTYFYCYPGLPRGLVLRCMRKWVGRPVTWRIYLEQIEIGRFRVWAAFK